MIMRLYVVTILALVTATHQQNTAPPASIKIGKVSYSGSGCPRGSVDSILADTKDIITFGFDKFQATIGPGSAQGADRKNCNINLQLIFGDGYQVAVAETVYHGYTRLDDGVNAKFTTEYSYKSDPQPPKKGHAEKQVDGKEGEHRGKDRKSEQFDHNHKHDEGKGDMVWSKCAKDEEMRVENKLVLSSKNQTASGEFQVDDETVKFTHKMSLKWKKCK